ncbi:DUF397 domain-containing protein [Parafrankia elaeagni]|uniref:DUF397 domain-containing protein n=1 Tax=Parafrankia elaeagni TaxID=222534 RepID=UPI000363C146|nr:DUF397 domain-containing protein [Parafrankia elaeagni]
MTLDDAPEPAWYKSSASGENGCVEVAHGSGLVLVRDSKNRDGAVLRFTAQEWVAFLEGVRGGEFDLE